MEVCMVTAFRGAVKAPANKKDILLTKKCEKSDIWILVTIIVVK